MELGTAPFAPVASTSRVPYQADSPVVATSDAGEREEDDAASGGEQYWVTRTARAASEKGKGVKRARRQATASDDELAMVLSSARPADETLVSPSQLFRTTATKRKRTTPSPPRSPPLPLESLLPSPPRASSRTSPVPRRSSLSSSRKPRSPSPVTSTASDDILDAIAKPKATSSLRLPSSSPPARRSPTPRSRRRSTQTTISEIAPLASPEPVVPAGRSFRTRTAAQLKPFSTEQFRYTKTLLRNGWEGAVVAGPRAVELSADEIRRKKMHLAGKRKDDLGGWLVDEEEANQAPGQPVVARKDVSSQYSTPESEESEDGLTLLEREARRKDRMARAADSALGLPAKKRARTDASPRRRNGPSEIDRVGFNPDAPRGASKRTHRPLRQDDASSDDTPRPARRARAESEPPSSSPGTGKHRSRARAHADGRSKSRGKGRTSTTARADSEPPFPSPLRGGTKYGSKKKSTNPRKHTSRVVHHDMARPSKSVRARDGRAARSALDADILNIPDAIHLESDDSDAGEQGRGGDDGGGWDGESEGPSDEGEEEEGDSADEGEEGEEESPKARRSRLRLDAKRKRALGAMLPAVFFKKAKADLKLMEQEREMGFSSGSELNSGDEEANEVRRNRAKVRNVPRLLDEPMRFDGDAFTDESGEEPNRTDSEEEDVARAENDAVSSWLSNFAPRRGDGGKGHEGDIVDRFLKRARRPTKPKQAKKPASTRRKGAEAGPKHGTKGNAPGRNGARKTTGGAREPQRRRRPTKAVALDTAQSIFVFAGLGDLRDETSDDVIVVQPGLAGAPAAPPGSDRPIPTATNHTEEDEDSEIWATFGKFTPDFDIQRLPAGVQFASTESFVRNGHLYSLAYPDSASLTTCDAFGLVFDSAASASAIESTLPALVDAVYDAASSLTAGRDAPDPIAEASRALRFLGSFVSKTLSTVHSDEKHQFGSALATQIDHLEVRLDNLGSTEPRFRMTRLVLSWYAVDLTARLGAIGAVGGDARRLARLVRNVVRRLVQHGIDKTLRSLKAVMDPASPGGLVVSEPSTEIWLGLVTVATRPGERGDATFDETDLWDIVLEETTASLPAKAKNGGPIVGELVSLTAMTLCAISQFLPSGISVSTPRLAAFWPAMLRSLDPIKPSALAASDAKISSTALSRRDRYLWTLFARSLVFVERWGWKLDVKDDVLAKLYDLLAARRLANLSTEPVGDFPSFLQNLDEFGKITVDRSSDSAFTIFVKLVIAAVDNLPSETESDKRKRNAQLTRLAVRLAPMTTAWTRQSPELLKSDTILVNHYSLLLTLAVLHPAQAAQKVEQAAKLVTFAETDDQGRKTSIRAILYFALAFRHFDISLEPVLAWLARVVVQLKSEYIDIEKQRRNREGWMRKGDRAEVAQGAALWQRALLLTMSLRSIQVILRTKATGTAERTMPDPSLLHPAWTSQLLQSPLALDPMIGREILNTVDCFLDLRAAALAPTAQPTQAVLETQGESQDDYGMDEFDFEDPALNALLGIDGGGGAPSPSGTAEPAASGARAADERFAELVKSTLAPAFFHLVSNIYGIALGSSPTVGDRAHYAEAVVESWTRCLDVLVQHRLDSWTTYLRYGNYSFQRIADPMGRIDIGLFLAIRILRYDEATYTTCSEEMISIWFSTIVSSQLTSQHDLTRQLLNVADRSPLFDNAPFARSSSTGHYEVDQLELLDKRVDLLRIVFSNAAKIVASKPSTLTPSANLPLAKPVVFRFMRDLLPSLRNHLSAIRDDAPRRSYANLVREVLDVLGSAGTSTRTSRGPFDETTLPEIRTLRSAIAGLT
ncbi:hypothetical protein JCM10212_002169 [Sporobolomyces blumeae]